MISFRNQSQEAFFRVVDIKAIRRRDIDVNVRRSRALGAVRLPSGRLMPKAAHNSCERTGQVKAPGEFARGAPLLQHVKNRVLFPNPPRTPD